MNIIKTGNNSFRLERENGNNIEVVVHNVPTDKKCVTTVKLNGNVLADTTTCNICHIANMDGLYIRFVGTDNKFYNLIIAEDQESILAHYIYKTAEKRNGSVIDSYIPEWMRVTSVKARNIFYN